MSSTSKEDMLLKDCLSVNIKTLKLAGLWNGFGDKGTYVPAYNYYVVFVWAVMLSHDATQFVDLFYSSGNLERFSTTASTFLTLGAAWLKQSSFLLSSKQIRRMVYNFRDGKLCSSSHWTEEQKTIARKFDRRAWIMSWSYYSLGIGTLSCCFMTSVMTLIFEEEIVNNSTQITELRKKLPYNAMFPFDANKPGNFGIAYGFQMLILFYGPAVNIGIDTLFVGMIMHACGQLRILKYSLRHLKETAESLLDDAQTAEDIPDETRKSTTENSLENQLFLSQSMKLQMSKSLNDCILHHQKILKFVMEMEEVFNPMMLAQFLSSSGAICVLIFLTSKMDKAGFGSAMNLQFLAISIMQLLLFCWYGNELTFQYESVVQAAYESPWYKASENFKRSIRIMVTRAMSPFILTGGKIYVMSLNTFIKIMQAIFFFIIQCLIS